ncbi:MAG: ATP-grasp domain-containing protein [Clostridia bacterium]|nr:ATP-grasp domain-containing protein [Clostridia bacterium]
MKKVAVLFGGVSCESEISVLTGTFVASVLKGGRYEVLPIYVGEKGSLYTHTEFDDPEFFTKGDFLKKATQIVLLGRGVYALNGGKKKLKRLCEVDAALNCCHGGLGEGGGVSALMELNEIPLASPLLTPSGVFLDKAQTKLALRALKIPTVDSFRVNEEDYKKRGAFLLKNIATRLKFPVIVKPAHLGSSIGISVAENEEEAKRAIESAFELDDRVLIEKFLRGKKDVNCAAYSLGGEIFVSGVEEAASGDGVYGFDEKYKKKPLTQGGKGGGRKTIEGKLGEKIRSYTRTVYKRMDLCGVVRMDFLVQGEEAYLSEVNTVPGSLAYYLFCERISDAREFFTALLDEAIEGWTKRKKRVLSTGILKELPALRK